MTSIAVVIPAFNAEKTISASIQSVLSQTIALCDVIVANDGSTDQTGAIAANADSSIRVITKVNGGQGSARAFGARHSKCDFLLFLDADDVLLPSAISRLSEALDASPGAVVAYCQAKLWNCETNEMRDDPLWEDDAEGDVLDRMIDANFIRTPGCVLIRRSALEAAGGWDPARGLKGHEDWDLWIRLAERGPFSRVADELLLYRVHGDSFSQDKNAMVKSLARMFAKHARSFKNDKLRGPKFEFRRADLCRRLSGGSWRSAGRSFSQGRIAGGIQTAFDAARIWPRSLAWPMRNAFEWCKGR